jgi:Fe-Mn family superoxide dismutase
MNNYELPELPYKYNDLVPFITKEQLEIHHQKHHQSYVNNANSILTKIDEARKNNTELDQKAIAKELSFNISGHILHSLFWLNMQKPQENNLPNNNILGLINKNFSNFERFKKEFSNTALSVEGSGWAALVYDNISDRLIIIQIEKHNVNLIPKLNLILVLDVWEHAYYLDYKNDRAKYIENFWSAIDWNEVNTRSYPIDIANY